MTDRTDLMVERADDVLTLTLNRPDRLNALTTGLMYELARLVEEVTDGSPTRVVVVRGTGRAFCSGADLADPDDDGTGTVEALNRLVTAVRNCPRPVLAAVQGGVVGLGVSIALSADLTVAADDGYFLLPFTGIGLMPDGGATALVTVAMGRAKAMRMALLGERLPATEAAAAGLIAEAVPAADFDTRIGQLVAKLRRGPARAYAATKRAINDTALTQLDAAFDRERRGQQELLAAADFTEGRASFLERREPRFSDL